VTNEDLSDFIDTDTKVRGDEVHQSKVLRFLLLFEFGQDRFGVDANCVDGVVPWKLPARIPGADPRVRGVLQDRGRIVVLMAHPAGLQRVGFTDGKRIVVCATPRGHIGLPATATSSVGGVELLTAPTPLSIHDGPQGAFTYLDPLAYGLSQ
jgi:chemotaxis signal transduction protein